MIGMPLNQAQMKTVSSGSDIVNICLTETQSSGDPSYGHDGPTMELPTWTAHYAPFVRYTDDLFKI